jgi:hypothetical protein
MVGTATRLSGFFFFAMFPVLVTRSTEVLKTKTSKELVSTSFCARFVDGTEKVKCLHTWQPIGLRFENTNVVIMDRHECPLYFQDWTNEPILRLSKHTLGA